MSKLTWSETWNSIKKRLEKDPDLSNFRMDSCLSARLTTPLGSMDFWKGRCARNKVPNDWCIDPLIGKPHLKKGMGNCTTESCRFAFQLHRILTHWPIEQPARVLEVGPGYGGLAERFCRFGNVSTYYLVDAPPMQQIQKYYMTEAGFIDKCRFEKPTEEVDIIISINSLGEMSKDEIAEYTSLFEQILVPHTGLMYLHQHRTTKKKRIGFEDYPLDDKWELELSDEDSPNIWNINFVEVFGYRK